MTCACVGAGSSDAVVDGDGSELTSLGVISDCTVLLSMSSGVDKEGKVAISTSLKAPVAEEEEEEEEEQRAPDSPNLLDRVIQDCELYPDGLMAADKFVSTFQTHQEQVRLEVLMAEPIKMTVKRQADQSVAGLQASIDDLSKKMTNDMNAMKTEMKSEMTTLSTDVRRLSRKVDKIRTALSETNELEPETANDENGEIVGEVAE